MNTMRHLLAAALLATLAACTGGAATTVNPNTTPPTVADYTGPAPATADVQSFRLNLWDNIKANNRCGGCHNATGQTPRFARNDDVNLAFADANTVVNLTQPDQSRMVVKVGGGHNCWLSSNQACADILTTWIRNWAGSAAGGGTQIQLQAPADISVGSSRSFPAASSDVGTNGKQLREHHLGAGARPGQMPALPFAHRRERTAVAVLRQRRSRGGLFRGALEDRPGQPGQLAPVPAPQGRVPQLLDHELRQRRGGDAGGDQQLREWHCDYPG